MLFLQKQLLPLLHRSAAPIRLSLQRALLLSTAAAAGPSSPTHFAAEDYLVTTCGLPREQAAKAAKWISHWKSPSQGDAVIAFLTGPALGLSKTDIASLVAKEPRVLNCQDKTLQARMDSFRSHGFSAAQIRSFIRTNPVAWRCLDISERLGFWVSLGSPDKFLRILRRNYIDWAGHEEVHGPDWDREKSTMGCLSRQEGVKRETVTMRNDVEGPIGEGTGQPTAASLRSRQAPARFYSMYPFFLLS